MNARILVQSLLVALACARPVEVERQRERERAARSPFACTPTQRRAVERTTADGAHHIRTLEACDFLKGCVRANATGRLREWITSKDAPSHSQEFEDVHLFLTFFDEPRWTRARGGGVYVELGALDGEKFANSLFYQRVLGWHGVLIEAALQNFLILARNVASGLRQNVTHLQYRLRDSNPGLPVPLLRDQCSSSRGGSAAACPTPTVLQIPLPSKSYFERGQDLFGRRSKNPSAAASDTGVPALCVPMATLLDAAPQTAKARGIELYSIDVRLSHTRQPSLAVPCASCCCLCKVAASMGRCGSKLVFAGREPRAECGLVA